MLVRKSAARDVYRYLRGKHRLARRDTRNTCLAPTRIYLLKVASVSRTRATSSLLCLLARVFMNILQSYSWTSLMIMVHKNARIDTIETGEAASETTDLRFTLVLLWTRFNLAWNVRSTRLPSSNGTKKREQKSGVSEVITWTWIEIRFVKRLLELEVRDVNLSTVGASKYRVSRLVEWRIQ